MNEKQREIVTSSAVFIKFPAIALFSLSIVLFSGPCIDRRSSLQESIEKERKIRLFCICFSYSYDNPIK